MTIVERVAQKLAQMIFGVEFDQLHPKQQEMGRDAARIAIQAMRLPTEEMLDRAVEMIGSREIISLHALDIWEAQIDLALGDNQRPLNSDGETS